jgi:hypothetical protein
MLQIGALSPKFGGLVPPTAANSGLRGWLQSATERGKKWREWEAAIGLPLPSLCCPFGRVLHPRLRRRCVGDPLLGFTPPRCQLLLPTAANSGLRGWLQSEPERGKNGGSGRQRSASHSRRFVARLGGFCTRALGAAALAIRRSDSPLPCADCCHPRLPIQASGGGYNQPPRGAKMAGVGGGDRPPTPVALLPVWAGSCTRLPTLPRASPRLTRASPPPPAELGLKSAHCAPICRTPTPASRRLPCASPTPPWRLPPRRSWGS